MAEKKKTKAKILVRRKSADRKMGRFRKPSSAILNAGLCTMIGAIITAISMAIGVYIAQEKENVRQLRELAYMSAIEEWKFRYQENEKFKQIVGKEVEVFLPSIADLALFHMGVIALINHFDYSSITDEEAAYLLETLQGHMDRRSAASSQSLKEFRENLEKSKQMQPHNGTSTDTRPKEIP